ncbi:hypothetical protein HHI36_002614, partial [Cryptolaemus montrouzieri]
MLQSDPPDKGGPIPMLQTISDDVLNNSIIPDIHMDQGVSVIPFHLVEKTTVNNVSIDEEAF